MSDEIPTPKPIPAFHLEAMDAPGAPPEAQISKENLELLKDIHDYGKAQLFALGQLKPMAHFVFDDRAVTLEFPKNQDGLEDFQQMRAFTQVHKPKAQLYQTRVWAVAVRQERADLETVEQRDQKSAEVLGGLTPDQHPLRISMLLTSLSIPGGHTWVIHEPIKSTDSTGSCEFYSGPYVGEPMHSIEETSETYPYNPIDDPKEVDRLIQDIEKIGYRTHTRKTTND